MTLSRHHGAIVSQTVIKRMLKTLHTTNEKPSNTLEQHYLWVELAVLSQFLVNLSFNNYLNGKYMYMYSHASGNFCMF